MKMFVLLLLISLFPLTDARAVYDPELCFLLDGFLSLYGLIITGLLINEKFFKTKSRSKADAEEVKGGGADGGYEALTRDAERGRNQRTTDDPNYTALKRRTDGEYKELPVRRERQKKEQLYQGLSSATRDTYDILQMQQLPAH